MMYESHPYFVFHLKLEYGLLMYLDYSDPVDMTRLALKNLYKIKCNS